MPEWDVEVTYNDGETRKVNVLAPDPRAAVTQAVNDPSNDNRSGVANTRVITASEEARESLFQVVGRAQEVLDALASGRDIDVDFRQEARDVSNALTIHLKALMEVEHDG